MSPLLLLETHRAQSQWQSFVKSDLPTLQPAIIQYDTNYAKTPTRSSHSISANYGNTFVNYGNTFVNYGNTFAYFHVTNMHLGTALTDLSLGSCSFVR